MLESWRDFGSKNFSRGSVTSPSSGMVKGSSPRCAVHGDSSTDAALDCTAVRQGVKSSRSFGSCFNTGVLGQGLLCARLASA